MWNLLRLHGVLSTGLLDGHKCTTHWKLTQHLSRESPSIQVPENRLFVREGNLITSAGVASGFDMAPSLIDKDFGPLMAGKCAHEMVLYIKRDG